MTRGNLIHALVESWKFNVLLGLIATHHVYESRFCIPFKAGVDVRDVKFSNLLMLRHIFVSKKFTKMFYYCIITSFSRNSMLHNLPISCER